MIHVQKPYRSHRNRWQRLLWWQTTRRGHIQADLCANRMLQRPGGLSERPIVNTSDMLTRVPVWPVRNRIDKNIKMADDASSPSQTRRSDVQFRLFCVAEPTLLQLRSDRDRSSVSADDAAGVVVGVATSACPCRWRRPAQYRPVRSCSGACNRRAAPVAEACRTTAAPPEWRPGTDQSEAKSPGCLREIC